MYQRTARAVAAGLCLLAPALLTPAHAAPWAPPKGYTQIELWPADKEFTTPDAKGSETVETSVSPKLGRVTAVKNVTRPTMTIYPPKGKNSGVTLVVFPGGGYKILAIDLEGTEVCDWATQRGITCVVLKYRVPNSGPHWDDTCNCHVMPPVNLALQDAQRAIGLLRRHAKEYHIDPGRIGVLGFSAGGHLVASVSTHTERAYAPVDAADRLSSVPDFVVALYPGHLWNEPGLTMSSDIKVTKDTPPTFIVQAEDDPVDDVRHSLTYYMALREAKVPTEMHLYARGGHAFGLRPSPNPIVKWPALMETWLHTIRILP